MGNQLIGDKKSFGVGHKFISKTERISFVADNFLAVGKCVTIIDTPGTKDTDGNYQWSIDLTSHSLEGAFDGASFWQTL